MTGTERQKCTHATRPPHPPIGTRIEETDTGRRLTWDGTAWLVEANPMRCSPANPCPARDPLHLTLWGECFHVVAAGGPTSSEHHWRPTSSTRPTLGDWVLGLVLLIHYRRWRRRAGR